MLLIDIFKQNLIDMPFDTVELFQFSHFVKNVFKNMTSRTIQIHGNESPNHFNKFNKNSQNLIISKTIKKIHLHILSNSKLSIAYDQLRKVKISPAKLSSVRYAALSKGQAQFKSLKAK